MEILLVKTAFGLKPIDDENIRRLKGIEEGEIVKAEYTKKRNIKFHKKYFALIKMMWENDSLDLTIERYRKEIEMAAGYFESYIGIEGKIVKEPRSISFNKMQEDEFEVLFQDILQIACMRLGVDSGVITEELKYKLGNFY